MRYGITMTLKEFDEAPAAAALLDQYLPGVRKALGANPMARNLSLEKLASYAQGKIPADRLQQLDAALQELGGIADLTDAEKEKIALYQSIERADRERRGTRRESSGEEADRGMDLRTSITPGKIWLDTKGERIQAHGGQIFYEDGFYYWIGENKEHTDGGRTTSIWTWGIRIYRSRDCYNWENLGLLVPPDLTDPDSCLFPDKRVDRPHLLHNGRTGQYILWIKLSGEAACFLVMTADNLTGPYKIIREVYRPFGYEVGDFDLLEDKGTGRAYLYMDANHEAVVGMELDDDWTGVSKEVSRSYEGWKPPFTREGIAVIQRKGKLYMFTSGMTGYLPNQSDWAVADDFDAPFRPMGDPYEKDVNHTSFHSQFTQVFRVPNVEEEYIVLADRWVPDYPMDAAKADMIRRCIAARYDPEHYKATLEEMTEFSKAPQLETADTSRADYVWLPLRFEGEVPSIAWLDSWQLR